MYPFGWSWEKALPPELPRRPKGRKQGTRSLIRSRRRGPNTVCIFHKTWKCLRKRLRVYPFWPPYCHFGRQNASRCLFGSIPEGVWNFKFFCYPLGNETDSKRLSKIDWLIWVFSCFLALVSKTAPRGLRDVPRLPKWSDFCLELYLLLPLFLFLTAATKENITRRLYEQLVWGCGDDPP